MINVRCQCGKILCQVAHLNGLPGGEEGPPTLQTPSVVILCRHCKRHMVLTVPAVDGVAFTSGLTAPREADLSYKAR